MCIRDRFRNLDLAQDRRDTSLGLMLQHGYISKEECEATKAIPVENTLKSNPISTSGQYQAYADKVIREVQETTGYDPYETPMPVSYKHLFASRIASLTILSALELASSTILEASS